MIRLLNDKVIKTLRGKIEKVNQDQVLEIKYRETINKQYQNGQAELKEKLKQSEEVLQIKEAQLKQLKFQSKDSSHQINSFTQKIKSQEDDLYKVSTLQMSKLVEIQSVQKTEVFKLQRISSIINNFVKMFQLERQLNQEYSKSTYLVNLIKLL